jgi:hypothetical protein
MASSGKLRDRSEGILNEAVIYFKVLYQYYSWKSEENQEIRN